MSTKLPDKGSVQEVSILRWKFSVPRTEYFSLIWLVRLGYVVLGAWAVFVILGGRLQPPILNVLVFVPLGLATVLWGQQQLVRLVHFALEIEVKWLRGREILRRLLGALAGTSFGLLLTLLGTQDRPLARPLLEAMDWLVAAVMSLVTSFIINEAVLVRKVTKLPRWFGWVEFCIILVGFTGTLLSTCLKDF